MLAVGGWTSTGDDDSPCSLVECYELSTNTWSQMTSMATSRGNCRGAVLDAKLYVAGGGTAGDVAVDSVELFDSYDNVWQAVNPMNCAQAAFGAAVLGDKLYVAG